MFAVNLGVIKNIKEYISFAWTNKRVPWDISNLWLDHTHDYM